jgi:hypothetical protein
LHCWECGEILVAIATAGETTKKFMENEFCIVGDCLDFLSETGKLGFVKK